MRQVRTPVRVAAVVLAAYVAWAGWHVAHHSLAGLARVGEEFQARAAGESEAIDALADDATAGLGYDGQFFLFIALDPGGAEPYIDEPPYRYSRILYPLTARVVALGREDLVPLALLLVNLIAVGAGTFAVATLLERHGLSAWFGALYGLYPGLFVAVSRDLAEPLAYALAAFGLLAANRRRVPLAAGAFAAAGLARETTLLFPLALAASLAHGRRFREAVLLAATVLPYLVLRGALWAWLGSPGAARAQELELVPLGGLAGQWPWSTLMLEQIYAVVAPALLCAALAVAARAPRPALLALFANVILLVVLLPEPSYDDYAASGRITLGVVLAFLLCLPAVLARGRVAQSWIVVVLWFAPWYALLPAAFER